MAGRGSAGAVALAARPAAATAVALTRLGRLDEASAEIEAGSGLARDSGYRGGLVWCQVARALSQLTRGDDAAARGTADQLAALVTDLQGNVFWSQIVHWWLDPDHAQPAGGGIRWLGGEDAAQGRWLAVRPAAGPGAGT